MAKNNAFLLCAILIIALIPVLAHAQYYNSNAILRVELINQEPDPVEPGEIVEVRFKIENVGDETLNDILVEIMPSGPFSVYQGGATRNIGYLQGAQDGADAVIVDYRLKVSEDAVEGENEIELRVKIGRDSYLVYDDNEFTIDVATRNAILAIDQVRSEPKVIEAGNRANVTLMLKNYANSLVENVHVTLHLNNTPFAPYDGSGQKRVYQVKSGYQVPLSYTIIAEPETESGLYKIPITITYEDERGTSYSRSDIISLSVGSQPDLIGYIKESTLLGAGKGTITVELANKGLTNLKFLTMSVQDTDDYEVLSATNTIYIGDIDSDDIETEDFDIYVNKDGQITIPVQLNYRDANNNAYTQTLNLELRVYNSKEQRQYGLAQRSSLPLILAVLIVIGLVWYFYRKRKKKK